MPRVFPVVRLLRKQFDRSQVYQAKRQGIDDESDGQCARAAFGRRESLRISGYRDSQAREHRENDGYLRRPAPTLHQQAQHAAAQEQRHQAYREQAAMQAPVPHSLRGDARRKSFQQQIQREGGRKARYMAGPQRHSAAEQCTEESGVEEGRRRRGGKAIQRFIVLKQWRPPVGVPVLLERKPAASFRASVPPGFYSNNDERRALGETQDFPEDETRIARSRPPPRPLETAAGRH